MRLIAGAIFFHAAAVIWAGATVANNGAASLMTVPFVAAGAYCAWPRRTPPPAA